MALTLMIFKNINHSYTYVYIGLGLGNRSRGGFMPSIHVRTSRAAYRLVQIHWKKGKGTSGVQVENPSFLKAGDQALVTQSKVKLLYIYIWVKKIKKRKKKLY